MDCGCVEVRDADEARAAGVIEQYERARALGVRGDLLVPCERHRAEAAASVASFEERRAQDCTLMIRYELDRELDRVVRGKPIRRR